MEEEKNKEKSIEELLDALNPVETTDSEEMVKLLNQSL